jgi:molybdenum cofactor cytidylyltransferase
MGKTNKLLSSLNGKPMVAQSVNIAIKSSAIETIVVTGYQSDQVRGALSEFSVNFVYNPNYKIGLSSSLKSGINAVSKNTAGALILLCDMPLVTTKTINTLIERFNDKNGKAICQPIFKGFSGNPVLWPREFFSNLTNIQGDKGARELIKQYSKSVSFVEVNDSGIHIDFNRPDDFKTQS